MSSRFRTFLFLPFLWFFIAKSYGQSASNARQLVTVTKGSSVVLRANSAGASSYIWYKDGILVPNQNKQSLITATAGIYKVASINAGGCTSDLSDEIEVVVQSRLSADVAITKRSEQRQVYSNQVFEYYLDVRNNGVDDASLVHILDILPENLQFESLAEPTMGLALYDPATRTIKWDIESLRNAEFAELVIRVRSKQAGMVSNTATVSAHEYDPNLKNNTSTDQKEIAGLHVPNVFTPNGDGKNDTFHIENLDAFDQNQLTIINRWGSTVYQSNKYLNDWTANGLSDGTYFYIVKVRNGSGDWLEYKGYITIIR
ncbi:gliding motility-associated C-terminal domain-containing protein [Pedobacter sp. AW1-32]|uniref:T9SS type B sorting domain-containing protein n=1 Tax=Pedobacter sp. AW1-32 TaxID=3383026 RepID=UPI003FED8C0C